MMQLVSKVSYFPVNEDIFKDFGFLILDTSNCLEFLIKSRKMEEQQISNEISKLRRNYENLILSSSIENEMYEEGDVISASGGSAISFRVCENQITHTIQSLFKMISELRALRAERSA